ncbi:MAG: 3-dehydroquinate synthase [Chloroflexota bacterium]
MRDLVLTGFMGTGKTSIACALAARYGLRCIDIDGEIERQTGSTIQHIFETQGEEEFRKIESRIFLHIIRTEGGRVIATGGGTLIDPAARAAIQADQPVITLTCSLQEIHARIGAGTDRPLAAETGAGQLEDLLNRRKLIYDLFPQVNTEDGSDVCRAISELVDPGLIATFRMLPGAESHVRIGRGLVGEIPALFAHTGLTGDLLVITDDHVESLPWMADIRASLEDAGQAVTYVTVPAGEQYKTLETVTAIYRAAMAAGLDRDAIIVGVGGGVVGDLAGMVAATYLRGVRLVLIPTTLLSQVDASIGGKAGVDLEGAKNLVGAFHPARLVVIDPNLLCTLPEEGLAGGLAEIVKIAMMRSIELLEWLEDLQSARDILDHPEIIRRAAAEKIEVVRADPFENGLRAQLNFGHTLGHALEAASNFQLSHGRCVAVGMAAETWLAERDSRAQSGTLRRLERLLDRFGLPRTCAGFDPSRIAGYVGHDKKRQNGATRFAVPGRAGAGQILPVDGASVRDAISHMLGEEV